MVVSFPALSVSANHGHKKKAAPASRAGATSLSLLRRFRASLVQVEQPLRRGRVTPLQEVGHMSPSHRHPLLANDRSTADTATTAYNPNATAAPQALQQTVSSRWHPRRWPTLAAALLASCAAAPSPPRTDPELTATALPASTRQVARHVAVQGHRGRLTRAEREALLTRLAAQGSASLLQRHLAAQTTYGEIDLTASNDATLLVDGPATFAAMFSAIEQARTSILIESYIIDDAEVAQKLAGLLIDKRAAGLEVAVVYDDVGSFGTPSAYFDQLRAAGVAVCAFNPVNPLRRPRYWNITHRDHRKIAVIDRAIAYTGGINISAVYSAGSLGSGHVPAGVEGGWRDTQIELRGPAAAQLDDLVRDTWAHQGCESELSQPTPAKPMRAAGRDVVQLIPASPDDDFNRIYAMLLTAIDTSRRSVHLTMAYFAPGRDMVDALADAARRGVDVQLILPSISDAKPVLYAGQSYYDRLLSAGVRIHELQDAVLHAKTAVIDGVVSTVGSSNLDWRSLSANNEVNAVVYGEDFGDAMEQVFARDVKVSREVLLADWRRRGVWPRMREGAARAFEALW
jgi:cardiolipin synthase